MEVLIFETDIKTKRKIKLLKPLFNNHPKISNWTIDLEDVDKVLRIETTSNLSEEAIINMVQLKGFFIQPLADLVPE